MNQHIKIIKFALAALLCLEATQLKADQTNLVQQLSIRLDAVSQSGTETNRNIVRTGLDFGRVVTSEVIKQLGTATGNSFSDKASLVVVTPLPDGNSAIVVRDGVASVDVSAFFVYEAKSGAVTTSQVNVKTGRGSSSSYAIERLALVDSPAHPPLTLHFDVQGVANATSLLVPSAPTRTELDAGVVGWGDQAGSLLLLQGSFGIHGFSLEVVPDNPPNA